MSEGGLIPKGGSLFSEEKGREQWREKPARVELRGEEKGDCDVDVKKKRKGGRERGRKKGRKRKRKEERKKASILQKQTNKTPRSVKLNKKLTDLHSWIHYNASTFS